MAPDCSGGPAEVAFSARIYLSDVGDDAGLMPSTSTSLRTIAATKIAGCAVPEGLLYPGAVKA